ncbi:uncharacterized protein BDZ99DRAFT_523095 [Mytilinidion resinicola]|uniref:RBR-type E3 ubiquitin transferase n=1 Tax=Mytilinidion resinicola TaxID=574789 RepID=A0A6A6YG23_9PEZI|nr:uncharacterized protein BDZ99DRAFT_523095 [Mytilinidion resinicola]KAF2807483.1 hypothetical protein BDZ99DRAFT_523095 [Mytilinidion resinicola]
MGSGSSKSDETATLQPGASRTAQFFKDEEIPISRGFPVKTYALPAHAIPNSPQVFTRGGDSDWDPHTPATELPARRKSSFLPWKKSSTSKAPQEPMTEYFPDPRPYLPDSRPSSVVNDGSEGNTPGSFVFSQASPASTVATPPTSPLSPFGSIRRKPIGLRPTASSPNLLAPNSSRPFFPLARNAQYKSTLSSLLETPAPSRPRRGSDLEPTHNASLFGAAPSLEHSRGQAPIPFSPSESNAAALSNNEQLLSDARQVVEMEHDLDLLMALSESMDRSSQGKQTARSPSPAESSHWRSPSPAPSDSSDDLVLYRGRNNARNGISKPRAATPQRISTQEQLDRELAQQIQREEEERASSHTSSSRTRHIPGAFVPPTFASSSSTFASSSSASSRGLHSNNPFSRRISLRSEPATELRDIPLSKATSPRSLDPDELLARQLQEEENRGVPRQASRPQEDADLALAIKLAEEENQHLRQINAAPKKRDCAVCAESYPIPDLPSLMNCEHEPQVCSDCYQGWIASELNSKSWKEIKCPEEGCKQILNHAEVQEYATPEVYAKFDALSAREALNDDPNFRWCRGPNCKSGQIHESDVSGNIFVCVDCGFKVCTVHEGVWHEGETCEEYDYRTSGRKEKDQKAQEEASAAEIAKITKKCPGKRGNCGWNIEKNDGCDHMTCTKCKHQFCWICMADYQPIRDKGNSEHETDCKYHSSKLPTLPPEQAV